MKDSTFITRVVLKNYKSIAVCDVQLQPLTFLVGRNGSGKSNFLDALRFVADALNSSLAHAIRDRGGINDVCRRSRGHPNHFSIRLEFALPEGFTGHYAFQIRKRPPGGYEVQTEECSVQNKSCLTSEAYFRVESGTVTDTSYDGNTVIAPVDDVSKSVVHDKLFTIGELLSRDQLQPDPASVVSAEKAKQLRLFNFEKRNSNRTKTKKEH